jgi:hypothetical protein
VDYGSHLKPVSQFELSSTEEMGFDSPQRHPRSNLFSFFPASGWNVQNDCNDYSMQTCHPMPIQRARRQSHLNKQRYFNNANLISTVDKARRNGRSVPAYRRRSEEQGRKMNKTRDPIGGEEQEYRSIVLTSIIDTGGRKTPPRL